MHIEVESIPADRLAEPGEAESSASIRARVERARAVQRERYGASPESKNIYCNAQLDARTLRKACPMKADARELLQLSRNRLNLSNRAYTRILKVARDHRRPGGARGDPGGGHLRGRAVPDAGSEVLGMSKWAGL